MRTINILGGLVLLGIMLVLLFSVSAVLHPISSMEHRTFRAQCPPPPSTPPSSSKMETQEKSKGPRPLSLPLTHTHIRTLS